MQTQCVHVYLDSSDYSTLSDPRRQSRELEEVRSRLAALAAIPSVRFVFSGAHLSEMAPLAARYARAATDRADVLVTLCRRNALISFDRLIGAELSNLASRDSSAVRVLSPDAEWYPDLRGAISPIDWADTALAIDNEIKSHGLSREHRRKLKRKLFRESRPTPLMRTWLATQSEVGDLSDILRLYPMRPQDARTLTRYTLGQATKEQAEAAFLESLRDPRWMMQWFAAHHDKLTPVTEWLRGPARNMFERLKKAADTAQDLYQLEAFSGGVFKAELLTGKGWQGAQDGLLINVTNRLLAKSHTDSPSIDDVALVDQYCPGLATAIRSIHSALRDSIGPSPRTLQESDFIDAVHAMYAPYVTIFRADRYMASHVRKNVGSHGTTVVSSLLELPDQIDHLV